MAEDSYTVSWLRFGSGVWHCVSALLRVSLKVLGKTAVMVALGHSSERRCFEVPSLFAPQYCEPAFSTALWQTCSAAAGNQNDSFDCSHQKDSSTTRSGLSTAAS